VMVCDRNRTLNSGAPPEAAKAARGGGQRQAA